MNHLPPLRFQPLIRRYLWGGRRLESLLGKQLPAGNDFAESWELVDHGVDQSQVLAGPCAGATLAELLDQFPVELLGDDVEKVPRVPASAASRERPAFPLLFKFLDAHQALSVQVHPNDVQAAQQTPPDLGKTEAWVVLHADPGAVLYAGLKRGFDRPALEREVRRGTTELCLHKAYPQVGDCFFIPAGTVHAIGAGLVVAEVQQSSDTTFRLFDWNRVGVDGKPRPLHIEQALPVIDYQTGPIGPQIPQATDRPYAQQLVRCEKFVLERWTLTHETSVGGEGKFRVLMVLDGALSLDGDPLSSPVTKGQTVLLPAGSNDVNIRPSVTSTILAASLP
jgi:mannose-6-phosphate isomerase